MCEACELRKIQDEADWEASAILRMLIDKAHAPASEDGVGRLEFDLTEKGQGQRYPGAALPFTLPWLFGGYSRHRQARKRKAAVF